MTMILNYSDIAVIVLAAGKGTRMKSTDKNKVASDVGAKPLILRTYENLNNQELRNIFVVVGFAKESVMQILGNNVGYIEQKEQLGTGHAVSTALSSIQKNFGTILVLQGDDSAFYTDDILKRFLEFHKAQGTKISLMTTILDNPFGLGRIIRKPNGNHEIIEIVEERNASEEQKKIKEINAGCYLFNRDFLDENLKKINKNPVSREYYLTDILKIASDQDISISTFPIPEKYYFPVNTAMDLKKAEKLL
jgi:bifunctional UDP-N-acetylglucosamine pyrophosphorylase/glucosamine-1-phosphate N-acetyltransferase